MTANPRDAFDMAEAVAERARLQQLLEDYDAGRAEHGVGTRSTDATRQIGPDRADKVRARIAGLDEIIGRNPD